MDTARQRRIETNFAVRKFGELPAAEKLELYQLLRENKGESRAAAGIKLLNLLTRNTAELGAAMGGETYVLAREEIFSVAEQLTQYFETHLQKSRRTHMIAIREIPEPEIPQPKPHERP